LKCFDYFIVGQGLAGSCVALQLLQRNRTVLVFDQHNNNTASRIAAGMFNPITGKNPALTWKAQELFPFLHRFYRQMETFTGESFFHPMDIYRPFQHAGEQNLWHSKASDSRFQPFIRALHHRPVFTDQVINPWGGMELGCSGYVDLPAFLRAVLQVLQQRGMFRQEYFDETNMQVLGNRVIYRDCEAKKIVFCTGALSVKAFGFLPLRPLKGEVLGLRTDRTVDRIYNRGVYVVPGIWKAGATYHARDLTPGPTQAGRQELEGKLRKLVRFSWQVTSHQAAFRPTTPDRRPLTGRHPVYENVYLLNGLGTKGVTLAPYFSAQLVDFMENGVPVNQEADIRRYI
jgi:glycine/D-amino acid oxidase-like deaminating enzyme